MVTLSKKCSRNEIQNSGRPGKDLHKSPDLSQCQVLLDYSMRLLPNSVGIGPSSLVSSDPTQSNYLLTVGNTASVWI